MEVVLENILERQKSKYKLKQEQIACLRHLNNGKHVLGCLPTGYGKSEVIKLFPLLKDEVR